MDSHNKYNTLWGKVLPLLQKAKRKDFVLHTLNVVKAMNFLIDKEGGDPEILIPAAYLHDVGWSEVDEQLQISTDQDEKLLALHQHIDNVPAIIKPLLTDLNYSTTRIEKIIQVVVSHKFIEPIDFESRLLIDADTLSDTFPDSFCSDAQAYNSTLKQLFEFREKNIFYTKTAQNIFNQHLRILKKML